MRRRALAVIMLLACCVAALFTRTLLAANALADAYAGVSVRIADTPVPARKLKRLTAGEAGGNLRLLAAWTRGEKVEAAAASMETTTKLRVIAVTGDMRQVAPMTLLSGAYPTEDDTAGCLLTAKSAEALFRSVEAVGTVVTIGSAQYVVRGVATYGEPAALVRSEDAAYENLEFAADDLPAGKADAEAFLYRYALSSDYVVVQNGLYARMLRGVIWLPAALMLLIAAIRLLCAAIRPRARRFSAIAPPLAAALACVAGLALLLGRTFLWPQQFLPTKCADFAFWRTLLLGWQTAWDAMALMTPLPKDVAFFRAMRACVFSVAGILLLVALLYGRLCEYIDKAWCRP